MAFGTVAALGIAAVAALGALAFGKSSEGGGSSRKPGRGSGDDGGPSGIKLDAGMPEYWEGLAISHLTRGTNPIALEALAAIYRGKGWPRTADLLERKAAMVRAAWAKHEPVPGWTYGEDGTPVPDPGYAQPGLPDPAMPRPPGGGGPTEPPQIQPQPPPAGPVDPSSIGLPVGGWIDAGKRVHYALQAGDWGAAQIAAKWGQPNGAAALMANNPGFPWGSATAGSDLLIPAGWWRGPMVQTTPAGGTGYASGGGGQPSGGGGKPGKPGVAGQYSNPPDKPPTGQVGGTPPGWKDPMAPPPGWQPPPGMPPAEPPGGPPFTPQAGPLTVDVPGIGPVELPGFASFGGGEFGTGQPAAPLQRGLGGGPTLPPEDVGKAPTPWTPW